MIIEEKIIERTCTCDACGKTIEAPNDENEVKLNAARYDYCPSCYSDLCSYIETFINVANQNP